jgi:hypothetical protein
MHWNTAKTLEQLGGDEAHLQEVVEIFLEGAPKHLAALSLAVIRAQSLTPRQLEREVAWCRSRGWVGWNTIWTK